MSVIKKMYLKLLFVIILVQVLSVYSFSLIRCNTTYVISAEVMDSQGANKSFSSGTTYYELLPDACGQSVIGVSTGSVYELQAGIVYVVGIETPPPPGDEGDDNDPDDDPWGTPRQVRYKVSKAYDQCTAGFEVWYSSDPESGISDTIFISTYLPAGTQNYTIEMNELQPDTTYYLRIRQQSCDGIFSDEVEVIPAPPGPYGTKQALTGVYQSFLSWGDYDNDGDLDIAVSGVGSETTESRVYTNYEGNFSTYTNKQVLDSNIVNGGISWGDYDNDGDLDTAVTGLQFGAISKIFINNNGSFNSYTGVMRLQLSAIAWGDYDNDGDLDLVISGQSAVDGYKHSNIYRNDNGSFVDIGANLTAVLYGALAWGDYDKDGDLDLALSGSSDDGYVSKIYTNDNGTFTDINAGLPGTYMSSMAWGDYDNDGDLDIGLAGYTYSTTGSTCSIYRNDNGTFTVINTNMKGFGRASVAWGDYDNDGDLDFTVCGSSGNVPADKTTKIYRNDDGSFTDTNLVLTGVYWGSLAVGDYDNDADLDLAITGETNSGTYITRIINSYYGDFNNPNHTPDPPSSGFDDTVYSTATDKLEMRWDFTDDAEEETPQKGMYYSVMVATETLADSLQKYVVSPTTGAGGSPLLGNYPHGLFCVDGSTQPGMNLRPPMEDATYYWKVSSIDTGLKRGSWSDQQSTYVQKVAPGKVTGLIAGRGDTASVKWMAPGDNEYCGNVTNGKWYVAYTSDSTKNFDTAAELTRTSSYMQGSEYSDTITGLDSNATWYFWIKAQDEVAGNWSVWSDTYTASDWTNPGEVTGLVVSTVEDEATQLKLSWIAPGDDEYSGNVSWNGKWQIAYSTNTDVETAEEIIEETTTYSQGITHEKTIDGLSEGTTYYFWVKAKDENEDNWSIWSSSASGCTGVSGGYKSARLRGMMADPTFKLNDIYSYPNPAKKTNPTIRVEVGIADSVDIKIFNIALDQIDSIYITDVPKVINNKYAYEYEWNVSGTASGIYIYTVVAEKREETPIKVIRKMTVIK